MGSREGIPLGFLVSLEWIGPNLVLKYAKIFCFYLDSNFPFEGGGEDPRVIPIG